MRKVVIVGAGGRDFHDFATLYRDDPTVEVVAFTAAQIPGIDARRFPAELAGPRYPDGIAIRPEAELVDIVRAHGVDEVVLAYSDLSHVEVMHKASLVLAAGASFTMPGPRHTMLASPVPVVAVCATRTGAGKSPTTRRVVQLVRDAGLTPVVVRHPMPYGDLLAMRVQRFATLADIDAAAPTVEEREEYEQHVAAGTVVYAGVDYAAILAQAAAEADVLVWDGGNNDFSFFRPDVVLAVTDAMRPGHEVAYHPGETVLRLADAVVVTKTDHADERDLLAVTGNVHALVPHAPVVLTTFPVVLDDGPSLAGAAVAVVEDGPTLTHGGMAQGAGTVAAQQAGAHPVDPRPYAVGSLADVYRRFPHLGPVLPAMGYGDAQVRDLVATLAAMPVDAIVSGTPFDLAHLAALGRPVRRARYDLHETGSPTLADVLAPHLARWRAAKG